MRSIYFKRKNPAKDDADQTIYEKVHEKRSIKRKNEWSSELTEMEKQVVRLRKLHSDKLLLFECGYRIRIFDDDAVNAARVLGLNAHSHRNFVEASIPLHRTQFHVKKLVRAGYKVGIVRQIEVFSNRNIRKTIDRDVDEIFTRATFEIQEADQHFSSFICSIFEETLNPKRIFVKPVNLVGPSTGSWMMRQVNIGLIFHDVHTGKTIFDEFQDDASRYALLSRLKSLEPIEFVLPTSRLSPYTEKIIETYKAQMCNRIGGTIREERLETSLFDFTRGKRRMRKFFKEYGNQQGRPEPVLPSLCISCFGGLLEYLKNQKSERSLVSINYTRFFIEDRESTVLPHNTIEHLEIFRNSATMEAKGSLFWVLNQTVTPFGASKLQEWILHPLLDTHQIHTRQNTVNVLRSSFQDLHQGLQDTLRCTVKFQRTLQRVHLEKAFPAEVWALLIGLQQVEGFLGEVCMEYADECLHSLTNLLQSYPKTETETKYYLQSLNEVSTNDDDIEECIREKMLQSCESELKAKYLSLCEELSNLEAEYENLLERFRGIIQLPQISYSSLKFGPGKIVDHLLELDKEQVNKVPSDWLLISSTQHRMRFHPKEIVALQLREDCIRNAKKKLVHRYWQQFLLELDAQLYVKGMRCVETLAEIDVFCSLGTVARFANYVRPQVVSSSMEGSRPILHIHNGRHPVIEQLQEKSSYISNNVELGGDDPSRCLLLSGPNMGGKSTYLRMCALIVIIAQLGSYVPAEAATVSVFDSIFAVIPFSLNDSASGRVCCSISHYELHPARVISDEMKILSSVLKGATANSLVLIDEVGYGIQTRYSNSVGYGCIRYLIENSLCLTLFASHMSEIISVLKDEFRHGEVLTHRLSYHHAVDDKNIIFQYEARNGVAEKSFALNTATLARIPSNVLNNAREVIATAQDQLILRK